MSVYLPQDLTKASQQIEKIVGQYQYAALTHHPVVNTAGRKWEHIISIKGALTDKELRVLKIKTYLTIVFSFFIAYFFKAIQNNLATIKSGQFETNLYISADTPPEQSDKIVKLVAAKFSAYGKDGNEKVQSIKNKMSLGIKLAWYELGQCYEFGNEGVIQDLTRATSLYEEAAKRGEPKANNRLGVILYQRKDFENAFKHIKLAADAGVVEAYGNIGICLYNGEGVQNNDAEAVEWFRKGVEKDNTKCLKCLAKCYINGRGVKEDKNEAKRLLEQAIFLGDKESKYILWSLEEK